MHHGAGGTGYANEGTEWDDTLIKMGIKEDTRPPKVKPEWVNEEALVETGGTESQEAGRRARSPPQPASAAHAAGAGLAGRAGRA